MRIFTLTSSYDDGSSYIEAVLAVKSYEDGRKENNDFSSLNARLMSVRTWNCDNMPSEGDFIANVYFKWDCCTHWYFYGEDYEDNRDNMNAYYHLCGTGFADFMDCLGFVATVLEDNFLTYEDSIKELSRFKLLNMKERYTIQELEDRPEWFNELFGHDFTDKNLR